MSDDFDLDSILEQTLKDFEEDEVKTSTTIKSSNKKDTDSKISPHATNTIDIKQNSAMSADRESYEAQHASAEGEDEQMKGIFDQLTQHFVDGIKMPIPNEDRDSNPENEDGDQYDEIMNNVIQQLLNKDMMYEPTKLICEKFPAWIDDNRPKLSAEDLSKYSKMFDCFQRIKAEYELEVLNFTKLTDLMFEVQQYGQPPPEIIQGVAPGLMFDSSGLPSFQATAGATKPSGDSTAYAASGDNISIPNDQADGDELNLPPEFNEEIARKIASGDCPTM